jgi:hypothetical protein
MLGNSMNQNKGLKTRLLEKLRAGFVLVGKNSGVRSQEGRIFILCCNTKSGLITPFSA